MERKSFRPFVAAAALCLVSCFEAPVVNAGSLPLECPEPTETGNIIMHTAYTVCYNDEALIPDWVAWELTKDETYGNLGREDNFWPDPDWKGLQADTKDYRNTGWSRGHMAPAGDMKWSEQAMKESFYMTNMCPQDKGLNAGSWNDLEMKCRQYARKYGQVYIACGPIVDGEKPRTISSKGITVPDRFFKVLLVYASGKYEGIGFIFRNDSSDKNFMDLAMSIDQVEEITGLNFFAALDDDIEEAAESTYNVKLWK